MKQFHEQQVQEVLMKKAAIDPPIYKEGYDVRRIVDTYNGLYEKKLDKKYVYKVVNLILSMKISIRSVVYVMAILCSEDESDQVDVHRLNEVVNLDLYTYAEILQLLEKQKVIKEINYTNPLDGYETADGDWHFVQNDYLFKTTKGTWYLKKTGRLFTVICDMFESRQDFYDFVVNRNLEMLRKII